MRFCGECGSPLETDTAAPPPSPPAPAAERRLVSVLFADLVGFTSASEGRDAEETRELLGRYFETARTVIERYGGTVEKFIGDAVMAVWGTPVAQEDDAERAVRAALELVGAIGDVAPGIEARAGVLTGEAAVTLGAQGQGMVAGDLVNTASRIQSAAEPGQVLVGERTRRATEAAIAFESAGEHELKGKADRVPLWHALRVTAGVRGALKAVGLETPFVGRERELRLVKELYHASADERRAHLVSVVGIAGVGKSRLGWEFFKYVDGVSEGVWWHRGRCLAYGEGVAFWALAEMVRMRARITEGEDPASARAKLRTAVQEQISDEEELRFVEPRLLELLGLDEGTARGKEELFGAWRLLFERMSATAPVVLLFEDLQWADAALVEFISYLLEWSRDFPIYVICLARLEVQERHPAFGQASRNQTTLFLEPLSAEAMEALLDGLVPGLPAELREQILGRAEGVPLYAVETIRMLLDRGLLVQEESVYKPTGAIEELEVPETLQGLIAARLDGLAPEERRMLQDASVLGKTFSKEALAGVAGIEGVRLEPMLSSLVRKEVLRIHVDPRAPERGQYGFLQDLVRRVAYDTLSRRDRKSRHLAAAEALQSTFGDTEQEIAEVVAAHYVAAYDAQPDAEDALEIRASARELLTRAGERAGSLAARVEARRYFERAAELADDALERARLLERVGDMAFSNTEYEEAERAFTEAEDLLERAEEGRGVARLSGRLAQVEGVTGRGQAALERLEQAYAAVAANELPDPDVTDLAARLGQMYVYAGDFERAQEPLELALATAQAQRLPRPLVRALLAKSLVVRAQGRPEEELALMRHALRYALENDLPDVAGLAYSFVSDACFLYDRYGEALEVQREALALARRVGIRQAETFALAELSYALAMTGSWDESLAARAELPDDLLRTTQNVSSVLSGVLEIHLHRGETEAARELLAHFDYLEDYFELQDRAIYRGARAGVLFVEGDHEGALASGLAAVELAGTLGFGQQAVKQGFVWAVEAALALGDRERADELLTLVEMRPVGLRPPFLEAQANRFRARLGDDEAGLRVAAASFREHNFPFWLAVTELERAEWLVAQGRTDEAQTPLDEAREIFERLEAKPWLERLARVESREPSEVA